MRRCGRARGAEVVLQTAVGTTFSQFKVMATNADGRNTAMTLAALGITSINLNANNYTQIYDDGSTIQGEAR